MSESCPSTKCPVMHTKYIGFQEMKMLLNSFIFSNFNYCPLVWHFCPAGLSQKIGKIYKRALRLLYDDSYSSYHSLLLKGERPTMEVSHLRGLAIKVFKTLKSLNPDFTRTYFKNGSHSARRKNDLVINRAKTTTFSEKSLRTLRPKIWNSLPEDVKDLTYLSKFIEFSKTWYGPECRCNICKYLGDLYHYT